MKAKKKLSPKEAFVLGYVRGVMQQKFFSESPDYRRKIRARYVARAKEEAERLFK